MTKPEALSLPTAPPVKLIDLYVLKVVVPLIIQPGR